jgi:hypothetical protein
MADAVSIEQTIRVQNALDETQLRIEQLQGQLRLLDDRTSLATIGLRLREQGVEPESEVEKASIPNAFQRGGRRVRRRDRRDRDRARVPAAAAGAGAPRVVRGRPRPTTSGRIAATRGLCTENSARTLRLGPA